MDKKQDMRSVFKEAEKVSGKQKKGNFMGNMQKDDRDDIFEARKKLEQ